MPNNYSRRHQEAISMRTSEPEMPAEARQEILMINEYNETAKLTFVTGRTTGCTRPNLRASRELGSTYTNLWIINRDEIL